MAERVRSNLSCGRAARFSARAKLDLASRPYAILKNQEYLQPTVSLSSSCETSLLSDKHGPLPTRTTPKVFLLEPGPHQPAESSLSCSVLPSGDIYVSLLRDGSDPLAKLLASGRAIIEEHGADSLAIVPSMSAQSCKVTSGLPAEGHHAATGTESCIADNLDVKPCSENNGKDKEQSCSVVPPRDIYLYLQGDGNNPLAKLLASGGAITEDCNIDSLATVSRASALSCEATSILAIGGVHSAATDTSSHIADNSSVEFYTDKSEKFSEHSYSGWRGTLLQRQEKYACHLCPYTTRYPSIMERHRLLHTGEKPHKCQVCSRGFRLRTTMLQHLRIHTDERPYQCKTCLRSFRHGSSLQKHERVHTGERPYQCETCDQTFSALTLLKRHRRTHTGEKPFACPVCDTPFGDAGAKKRHMRRKHAIDK
ncbi:uncharacterized protein [Dermacentor albipictus]|uniref:uncharacterized protein isoform X1 n=1 Tax=Dermacentor albipictus TaxID=60249 RepID=UPI0038FCCE60